MLAVKEKGKTVWRYVGNSVTLQKKRAAPAVSSGQKRLLAPSLAIDSVKTNQDSSYPHFLCGKNIENCYQ